MTTYAKIRFNKFEIVYNETGFERGRGDAGGRDSLLVQRGRSKRKQDVDQGLDQRLLDSTTGRFLT